MTAWPYVVSRLARFLLIVSGFHLLASFGLPASNTVKDSRAG